MHPVSLGEVNGIVGVLDGFEARETRMGDGAFVFVRIVRLYELRPTGRRRDRLWLSDPTPCHRAWNKLVESLKNDYSILEK